MMYSWLQLTKNWAVVCKTSIRYTYLYDSTSSKLFKAYSKKAVYGMCINFHQDSSKTERQVFIATYRQIYIHGWIDFSGDAD